MKLYKKEYTFAGLAVVIAVILDRITKVLTVKSLALYESKEIIKGFLSFTHVRNIGAGWSILEGQMGFFYGITLFACILLYYIGKDFLQESNKLGFYSCYLIIGGALGNLIDRIVFKYVIDFIDVMIFTYDYPVFNVADCFVVVGGILLALSLLLKKEKKNA